ncbi:hypothetical protein [Paenibacillus sp. 481]|uniref:hypothetical protein n=1 Tax=Paenibacillus sp. 481 TaxID=2835869 RepID=UPI001E54D9B3|nr:hypothetical protein [Paenibacillus sp. 481]UHA74464.1 hypothetical protein KIK04_04980 [Paenibacillus sp. 481]
MSDANQEAPKIVPQVQVAKPENKQVQQEKPHLIYIGPTIEDGRIVQYTPFIGGIPEYLKDVIERKPEVRELFVPISDFPLAQMQMLQQGTPLRAAYLKLKGE